MSLMENKETLIQEKAFNYVYSRLITSKQKVKEHDPLSYHLVDPEVAQMMLDKKKDEVRMYQYLLKKIIK